ncbi:MAG: P-loop NTPase, partial [Acidimicrobiales bacterium]
MPVTDSQVIEALRPVQDPELHLSIVELGMVRGVTVEGSMVSVEIALTVAGCPMRAEITERVTAALAPLGVADVAVELSVMTDEERAVVRARMGGGAKTAPAGADGQRLGHEEGRANPFMVPGSRTRVLGISSGKGGVGKSSVTVNCAVALARLGHSVAVLDADVYGFSVPKMLGISQE